MNLINLIFSILFSPCNWTKENNFYVLFFVRDITAWKALFTGVEIG